MPNLRSVWWANNRYPQSAQCYNFDKSAEFWENWLDFGLMEILYILLIIIWNVYKTLKELKVLFKFGIFLLCMELLAFSFSLYLLTLFYYSAIGDQSIYYEFILPMFLKAIKKNLLQLYCIVFSWFVVYPHSSFRSLGSFLIVRFK